MFKSIPAKITSIYLVVGLIWILITDNLGLIIGENKLDEFYLIQNFKGIFFVLTTGSILFWVLKKNEKSLQQISNKFETTFQLNPLPMALYDIDKLSFISVNNALCEHLGYSENELVQKQIFELFSPEDQNSAFFQNKSIKDKNSTAGIWRLLDKSGKKINVTLITTKALGIGDNARLAIAIDAEDHVKQRDSLKFKNDQLSAIQYITSHKVRNHLANILALENLITLSNQDEIEREGILQKIAFSAKMLDEEIKNLIDEASKRN